MLIELHAPTADVEKHVGPWGTVEPVDDSRCRLRMSVDDLAWPALILGAVGVEFTVLSPPELTDHLRRMGELFSRAVG